MTEETYPIRLRIVVEPDPDSVAGVGVVLGYRAKVLDAETGRELDGVYGVDVHMGVDCATTATIQCYPAAVDVEGEALAVPDGKVAVALRDGQDPQFILVEEAGE